MHESFTEYIPTEVDVHLNLHLRLQIVLISSQLHSPCQLLLLSIASSNSSRVKME